MRSRRRAVRVPRKPRKRSVTLKDGSVPERVTQASILKWLASTGLLYWRANAGRIGHYVMGPDGMSDIVVIVPPGGLFLGLEVKSAKGTQRKSQKLFEERLVASGGVYRIVRTLAEAMNVVAEVIGAESWKQKQRCATAALMNLKPHSASN